MYTVQQLQRCGSARWYLEMVSGGGRGRENEACGDVGARRKTSGPSWKAGGGVFVILGAPAVGESGEAAGHLGRTEQSSSRVCMCPYELRCLSCCHID